MATDTMNEKTYIIKIKVNKEHDNYNEIEQALYNMNITDVDLLEVYDD